MIKKANGGYAYFDKTGEKRLTRIYPRKDSPGLLQRIKEIEFFKRYRADKK
jgi:hypothetical protein